MNYRSWIAEHRSNFLLRASAKAAARLLRAYDNQHNWDIATNGEAFLLRTVLAALPGDVLDVGANVGDYALLATKIPGVTTVHCFELSPPTFLVLQERCNGISGIRLNGFGLSDADETIAIFHAPEAKDRTSIYAVQDGFARERVSASVRRGDAYLEENHVEQVSLLKIDVEGHDLATLRGFAAAFAKGSIAAVQFEHGAPSIEARVFLRDLTRFLQDAGMRCYRLYPASLECIADWDAEMEDFRSRNYVALRPDTAAAIEGHIAEAKASL